MLELKLTKKLNKLPLYLHSAVVRWALTIIWTAISASLMLSPSGDGTTVSWVSKLFGGTEINDAVGHVIINAVLALLWCWIISLYTITAKMTRVVLIGGIIWCFGAELSQFFVPERGASLLDLVAEHRWHVNRPDDLLATTHPHNKTAPRKLNPR